jgi:hypothetical protein
MPPVQTNMCSGRHAKGCETGTFFMEKCRRIVLWKVANAFPVFADNVVTKQSIINNLYCRALCL